MQDIEEPTAGRIRRRVTTLWWLIRLGLAFLFVVGVLIRLTIKDSAPVASTVFYATPIPVLTFLAVFVALSGWSRYQASTRWIRIGWLLSAIACGLWMWQTQWTSPKVFVADEPQESFRVLFWNAGRGPFGWQRVADVIREYDADIIGMTESSLTTEKTRAFWKREFPEYDLTMLGGRFVCLTRGDAGIGTAHHLSESAQYRQLDITIKGSTATCVIADLKSNPFYSRRQPLAELAEVMRSLDDHPTMLMADFNTPADSVHFAPLRETMTNAFERAGEGYAPTWPVPVPVLVLDQVWVNRLLTPVDARLGWTAVSDHRPVIVDIRFSDGGPTAQ